jgi:hypothetical protein
VQLRSRSNHEGRSELRYSCPRPVYVVSATRGFAGRLPSARVEHCEKRHPANGRGVRRFRVIVHVHAVADVLCGDEIVCVRLVSGADRHDLRAESTELRISVAQLRGILAAVQSAEMTEEDEHDWPLVPFGAEPVQSPVLIR